MALTKETVVDKIEVLENGALQVRRATYIVEDGVRLPNPAYHRSVVSPGDDTSQEDARVKAVAAAVQTPTVIKAFQDAMALAMARTPTLPR